VNASARSARPPAPSGQTVRRSPCVARPQDRGKFERFFGTVTTELLPDLPGHVVHGQPVRPPRLTLPQLDTAIRQWITGTYHQRSTSPQSTVALLQVDSERADYLMLADSHLLFGRTTG